MVAMNRLRCLASILVVLALLVVPGRSAAQDGFQLIVHADNPYSSISQQQASDFFLKKDRSWDDGTPAQPVDLLRPQSLREAFSEQVLDKSLSEVKKYWQRLIFTGRDSSPPEKSSEAEVIAYVRANRGAIGYVSSAASLGSGVRRLELE